MTRDQEVELVVKTIGVCHAATAAALRSIWHRCSFSGWLRGDIEDGERAAEWKWAVETCQRAALVSVRVQ